MGPHFSFAELLRKGIIEIQAKESLDKKKPREEIYKELAEAINRKASTVDYYLRGHVPTALKEVEQLARVIFKRGAMDKKWLDDFLATGGHPNPSAICNELLTPDAGLLNSQSGHQFRWLKLHHHVQRFANKSSVAITQAELQSTSDLGLESVRFRNIAELPNENESLFLEFTPGQRDDYGNIEHKILRQNSELLVWIVLFSPPLRSGQIASFSYRQSRGTLKNWTFEEIEQMYNVGVITKKLAYVRYSILAPVASFRVTLDFPPRYPISLPSSGGIGVYRGSVEDLAEKTRLVAENSFSANFDRTRNQWTLQLNVSHASLGISYELQWIPPRENKIFV